MRHSVIGIVGAAGAVGSAALDGLHTSPHWTLRAGYRSQPARNDAATDIDWRHVNVDDSASLGRFCDGCTVVLNTAGPSCRIGDRVARAADVAGADYVDAFGGVVLVRQLAAQSLSRERRVIHSAGVYPGLSAVLPRWLVRQGFDRVHALRGWAGGRERCTPAAAADVLLSTIDGFGQAGVAWIDGRRVTDALPPRDEVELVGFPGRVHVQPFFSQEMEQLAGELGLRDAHWNNVMPSGRATETIARWCGRLSARLDDSTLEHAISDLVETARRDVAGQAPYYRLVLEMDGERAGRPHCVRVVLNARDSYRVSGTVAASAVSCLLDTPPAPGIHSAGSVLAWEPLLDRLRCWGAVDSFSLVELPVNDAAVEAVIEEGTL